jgi:hypothetical protein
MNVEQCSKLCSTDGLAAAPASQSVVRLKPAKSFVLGISARSVILRQWIRKSVT